MASDLDLLRHFLAALAYRFQKTVLSSPPGFGSLEVGNGARAPLAIVHHMNGVLGYANGMLRGAGAEYWHLHPVLDWQGEVETIHVTLAEIDEVLLATSEFPPGQLARLLQGPLADAMTHVGQLAMLRRLAGSPIPSENFYRADIVTGQVGQDQPKAVAPDRE